MVHAGWDLNYSPFRTFKNKRGTLSLSLSILRIYFISYILVKIEVILDRGHFPLNRNYIDYFH